MLPRTEKLTHQRTRARNAADPRFRTCTGLLAICCGTAGMPRENMPFAASRSRIAEGTWIWQEPDGSIWYGSV